jgi:AcrR family transcriptional regulator
VVTGGTSERKSERTRRAILEAARTHFAARGFDGANLRAIGAEASIDPSMLLRYFGSKEGLFAAAVEMDLQLPDLLELPRAGHGLALATHFLRRWEGDLSDHVLVTLLRSAVTNHKVAEQLRTVAVAQLRDAIAPVVDAAELAERVALLAGQTLGIALSRYILELPGMVELTAEQLALDVAPTLQRYLYDPLPRV